MNAGSLRQRVTIESRAGAVNAYGEPSTAWQSELAVWASVEALSGRELLLARQSNAETSHRVRMRYLDGLTADKRLSWRGHTLEIISVIDQTGLRVELELSCRMVD